MQAVHSLLLLAHLQFAHVPVLPLHWQHELDIAGMVTHTYTRLCFNNVVMGERESDTRRIVALEDTRTQAQCNGMMELNGKLKFDDELS